MLSASEYARLDAVGLSSLYQQRKVSAAELLACALEQAACLNPALNAIVFQNEDEARAAAAQLDQNRAMDNKVAGVPFLIKEVNAVQGWPHTRGLKMLATQRAACDSAIVKRYRDAGLVLFGSTNTPELCMTITTEHSIFGPCDNPRKPGYSTGGSSGGAAAAVAAGIVPAADGSDGSGSIRIPAACCGLIGLKPSRGLTVVDADFASAWSGLSVGNVLTRSVRDSAAFLDILKLHKADLFALPPPPSSFFTDYSNSPGKLRIALHNHHPAKGFIHEDCVSALNHAAKRCEDHGHSIEEAIPPVDYARMSAAMATIINVHSAQIVSRAMEFAGIEDLDNAGLSESSRRICARGFTTSAASFLQAMDTLKEIERQMEAFFQRYDLVLSPVLSLPPCKLGWLDMDSDDIGEYARRYGGYSPFTGLYNATGQPSINLPLFENTDGLPIGVMASSAWGRDDLLLRLAHQLIPGILPVHAQRQLL